VDRDPRVVRVLGALERYRGMRTLFADAICGAEGRRFDPRRAGREKLLRTKSERHGRGSCRRQPSDEEANAFFARDPWHRCWCAYLRLTRPALYHGQAFWDNAVEVAGQELNIMRKEVEAELVCAAMAILGTVDTVAALRPLSGEKGPDRYACAVGRIAMAVLDEAGTVPEFKIPLLAAVGVRCGRHQPNEAQPRRFDPVLWLHLNADGQVWLDE
jgi:hypothetical protein